MECIAIRFKEGEEFSLNWARVEDWYNKEDPLGDYFLLLPYKTPELFPSHITFEQIIERVLYKMRRSHTMISTTLERMKKDIQDKCELVIVELTIK